MPILCISRANIAYILHANLHANCMQAAWKLRVNRMHIPPLQSPT